MQTGDLVRMKYSVFWLVKNSRNIRYTDAVGIVIKPGAHPHDRIQIMMEGKIHRGSLEHWEVISESR